MTKAELIAAIADAPDDAVVTLDSQDGILRTLLVIDCDEDADGWEIRISWEEPKEDE